ncbi:b(0,+)-type amino acid transporter 1-like [Biomphalaria glabrata]|uniref:B(0,+)-type amino acid transporter 1-like n=1 Tax=Biomphalaria glabrata TaxID=6526 RepID=A0A9W3AZ05_BIOGL|nr:b(0,+)-type amino acid transporter 1-like [Biomphalaria glabrata]
MSINKEVHIEQEKVVLRKELGFVSAASFVVGSIIGSGIFISPKGVLQNTGSVGLCLVVWAVAGLISLGSALCYAEMGAMIGISGGQYTYIRLGLGNFLGFIFAAQKTLLRNSISQIIMLLTFAKYTVSLLPTCGSPLLLEKLIAALTLVGIVLINMYSSRIAARLTVVTTAGKTSALIVICVGGVVSIIKGVNSELSSGFSGTRSDPSSIALAFYSALWAYGGAANLTCLVEEIKSPGKNVPRSIMTGCLFTLAIYVMTNVSYLAVMTRSELLQSNAVAALFADKVLQNISILIPVAVMVSTFGSTNNNVLSTSRITFTAARDGNLPDFLSYIQISQLTPFGAMTITVSLSLLYLLPADLGQFISLAGFLDAFFDACTFVALIRFRLQTMKDAHRPVKIPLLIPILMSLVKIYLFVAPIIFKPRLEYVYVAASVFTGATLLYIPFVRFGLKVPFYDNIVTCLQLIFEVCPPAKSEHKP